MTPCISLCPTFNLVSAKDPPDSYECISAEACLLEAAMNSLYGTAYAQWCSTWSVVKLMLSGTAHNQWYSTCLAWQALESIPRTAKLSQQYLLCWKLVFQLT